MTTTHPFRNYARGPYVRETERGALVFHPLSAPTEGELAEVAKRTALRVKKVLARHGRSLDGTSEREGAEPSGEQMSLSALCAAAASGQGLFGERAGKPLLRVVDPKRARAGERVGESQTPREALPVCVSSAACVEPPQVDVSICVRRGGVTRWLEAATTPEALARVLAKHGLGARAPPPELRARTAQLRLAFPSA